MKWSLLGVGAAILLALNFNASVHADCVPSGARQLKRRAARVLEGTVVTSADAAFNRRAVTVEVHRVWKGLVTPDAVFYYEAAIDAGPVLKIGDRRVFFAYRQSADERRKLYGFKDDLPTLFILGCDGATSSTADVIEELGHARTPRN